MSEVLMVISFALAIVYVLVLAVTLVLVLVHLRRAANLAGKLGQGLDQVARQTTDLPQQIGTINGALNQLLEGLLAVGGHYRRLVEAVAAERPAEGASAAGKRE